MCQSSCARWTTAGVTARQENHAQFLIAANYAKKGVLQVGSLCFGRGLFHCGIANLLARALFAFFLFLGDVTIGHYVRGTTWYLVENFC